MPQWTQRQPVKDVETTWPGSLHGVSWAAGRRAVAMLSGAPRDGVKLRGFFAVFAFAFSVWLYTYVDRSNCFSV